MTTPSRKHGTYTHKNNEKSVCAHAYIFALARGHKYPPVYFSQIFSNNYIQDLNLIYLIQSRQRRIERESFIFIDLWAINPCSLRISLYSFHGYNKQVSVSLRQLQKLQKQLDNPCCRCLFRHIYILSTFTKNQSVDYTAIIGEYVCGRNGIIWYGRYLKKVSTFGPSAMMTCGFVLERL